MWDALAIHGECGHDSMPIVVAEVNHDPLNGKALDLSRRDDSQRPQTALGEFLFTLKQFVESVPERSTHILFKGPPKSTVRPHRVWEVAAD